MPGEIDEPRVIYFFEKLLRPDAESRDQVVVLREAATARRTVGLRHARLSASRPTPSRRSVARLLGVGPRDP